MAGKRSTRWSCPFKASWDNTLTLLERELTHLKASSYVLQLAVREQDIGISGTLKAGVKPSHPGVILCIDTPHGSLQMPCDTYPDWKANVRAIALSLEALRAVNRHGVSQQAEQYRGWMKLPQPGQSESALGSKRWLAEFLGLSGGVVALTTREQIEAAIRQAEMRTHPDRGGDKQHFYKVQQARELLLK